MIYDHVQVIGTGHFDTFRRLQGREREHLSNFSRIPLFTVKHGETVSVGLKLHRNCNILGSLSFFIPQIRQGQMVGLENGAEHVDMGRNQTESNVMRQCTVKEHSKESMRTPLCAM